MASANGGTPSASVDIKTMKLYWSVEARVENELKALGLGAGAALDASAVAKFDCMHYHGTDAVDVCISTLNLTNASKVLDVGAGLGGPARHMAAVKGCNVIAVELQDDLCRCGADLTKRCGLANLVQHECCDFLGRENGDASTFDAVTSWLCFLHVPDKAALLAKCASTLKAGGMLLTEDFYEKEPFTAEDVSTLEKEVYAAQLPARPAYESALAGAGFVQVQWIDMTADWAAFTADRLDAYKKARSHVVGIHGETFYDAQLAFYQSVADLFQTGRLGGVRIVATKA